MPELKRLFGYMRPYLGRTLLAFVLLALAGALMSGILATLKPLADEVFRSGATAAAGADTARAAWGFDVLGRDVPDFIADDEVEGEAVDIVFRRCDPERGSARHGHLLGAVRPADLGAMMVLEVQRQLAEHRH